MSSKNKVNIVNKRARFEYHLLDKYTAGIQLSGSEIKSIRAGRASITEAFVVVERGEVFIRNMHIAEYKNASYFQHKPKSDRKLLLKRQEINRLERKLQDKGLTVIPLRIFINENGWAKVEFSVAKGKKLHDKRQDLRERDDKRDMERIKKNY